jgi:hypothetical protein
VGSFHLAGKPELPNLHGILENDDGELKHGHFAAWRLHVPVYLVTTVRMFPVFFATSHGLRLWG